MFTKTTLPNGVRLITVPLRNTEAVTCLVLVGAGSAYESARTNGVAHFLEHMMFKGTERRPTALEISTLLDGIGSEYNAFTEKELTGYYVKAASEHLELALDMLSDSYRHSRFAAEEIEKERGVITEEINMYLDTPARHIGTLWEELLWGDTPTGRSIAGRKENIAHMQRADFMDYLSRHYTGPNTVVAVAGRAAPARVRALVARYFGGIEKRRVSRREYVREAQTAPRFKLQPKETDQTHLMVGVRAFARTSPKRHALGVLATILGGGMSSRLFTEVRERRGLAYSVHTGNAHYADAGYLVTQAGIQKESAGEALRIILGEYRRIAAEGVPPEELAKAKNILEGHVLLGLETSDALAAFVGEQEVLDRRIRTPREVIAKVRAVTRAAVRNVAREVFRDERLNAVLLGPFAPNEEASFAKELTFAA